MEVNSQVLGMDGNGVADDDAEVLTAGFSETLRAMHGVGLTDTEIEACFRILAGVLHIGNLAFVASEDEEQSSIVRVGISGRSLRLAVPFWESQMSR